MLLLGLPIITICVIMFWRYPRKGGPHQVRYPQQTPKKFGVGTSGRWILWSRRSDPSQWKTKKSVVKYSGYEEFNCEFETTKLAPAYCCSTGSSANHYLENVGIRVDVEGIMAPDNRLLTFVARHH